MNSSDNLLIVHQTNVKNSWMHCVCTVGFDLLDGHAIQEICGQPLTQKEQMEMFTFLSLLWFSYYFNIVHLYPFQMEQFPLPARIYITSG